MNYSTMICLDIIVDNTKTILVASTKCNWSLVADIEFVLIVASFINVQTFMIGNIRIFWCIWILLDNFSCQSALLASCYLEAIFIWSLCMGNKVIKFMNSPNHLACVNESSKLCVYLAIWHRFCQILDPYVKKGLQFKIFFFIMFDSMEYVVDKSLKVSLSNFLPSTLWGSESIISY